MVLGVVTGYFPKVFKKWYSASYMKEVFILNKEGQKLSAVFHYPFKKTDNIVIFSHSFKSNKDEDLIAVDFARKMCEEGYAVVRYDYWGSGDSDGRFEESSISSQVEDLKSVIEYVKELGYKDICLVGLSFGAANSVMACDESIKCMVLWSPGFDFASRTERHKKDVLERGFAIDVNWYTKQEFKIGQKMWEDFRDMKPVLKLSDIKCPVLVIAGTEDESISIEKAKKDVELISLGELEIIEGGDHDFLVKDASRKALKMSVDFVKKYL